MRISGIVFAFLENFEGNKTKYQTRERQGKVLVMSIFMIDNRIGTFGVKQTCFLEIVQGR